MNILGISGTPRKGGNSEILLNAAMEPFAENGWKVTKILLSEKIINCCTGCEACCKTKKCFINDEMNEIYDALDKCDALIISAPAYYRNVPAQLKAVMDRTFAVREKFPLKGKLGGAICVGRGQSGGQCIVLNIIHNYYLSCGMLCVPGELNGVSAVADKPGDILNQPQRLEQARILGRNILKHIKDVR
ncbi:MAG: flavodoxin family protein [Clostridiales bacterium]|jgi:multimeric flavodoxin WrbA|nr:flavodoxin family protein [Clostridiales bacterium]